MAKAKKAAKVGKPPRNPEKEEQVRQQINRVLLMAQLTSSMFKDQSVAKILTQVVIDFNSSWSKYADAVWGDGNMMKVPMPSVQDIADGFAGKNGKKIAKLDIDRLTKLAEKCAEQLEVT